MMLELISDPNFGIIQLIHPITSIVGVLSLPGSNLEKNVFKKKCYVAN